MIKMKSTVKFTVLFLPFAPSIRMAEKERFELSRAKLKKSQKTALFQGLTKFCEPANNALKCIKMHVFESPLGSKLGSKPPLHFSYIIC